MARRRRGPVRKLLRAAGRAHRIGGPSTRVADWRTPVDGRAPRLGTRQYIGHDVEGRGAWARKDPLKVPRWWSGARFGALAGWAALTAGTGYLSWRRHGGASFVFGREDESTAD